MLVLGVFLEVVAMMNTNSVYGVDISALYRTVLEVSTWPL